MPDDKQNDPFEDHIESEAFDISRLDVRNSTEGLDPELKALLDELPHPLDYHIWDESLNERQKYLCAHLTTELVDRVIRANHGEEVADLEDEDLMMILTVPIALAMIVQEKLGETSVIADDFVAPDDVNLEEFRQPELDQSNNPLWAKKLGLFVNNLRDRIAAFFQRFRRPD